MAGKESLRKAVPRLLKEGNIVELKKKLLDPAAVYTLTAKDLALAMIIDHRHSQYQLALSKRMCRQKFLPASDEDKQALAQYEINPLDLGEEADLPLPIQERYRAVDSEDRAWHDEHEYRVSLLPLAALLGHSHVLMFLHQHCHAHPSAVDSLSGTSLTLAAVGGRLSTFRVLHRLLKKNQVRAALSNSRDCSMRTPLKEALHRGDVEMVRYILDHFPISKQDHTALYSVMKGDDRRMLDLMMEKSKDQMERAVQHLFMLSSSVDCLYVLARYRDVLRTMADPVLHTAHPCLVGPILKLFPDWLEARDSQGLTPLLRAVERNCLTGLGVLLDHQADLLARDLQGWSVMHYLVRLPFACRRCVHFESDRYLGCMMDHRCSKIDWIFRVAELQPHLVHQPDDRQQTPLHHAMLHNKRDSVAALIMLGAHPSAQDWQNKTPLGLLPVDVWLERMIVYAQMRVPREEMVRDMTVLKSSILWVCWKEHLNALLLAIEAGWMSSEELQTLRESSGHNLSRWPSYKHRVPTVCQAQTLMGWSRSKMPRNDCLYLNTKEADVHPYVLDIINYTDFNKLTGLLVVLEDKLLPDQRWTRRDGLSRQTNPNGNT